MNSLEQTPIEYSHMKTAGKIFAEGFKVLFRKSVLGKTDEMHDIYDEFHFSLYSSLIITRSKRNISILLDQNSLDPIIVDRILNNGNNYISSNRNNHRTANIYTLAKPSLEIPQRELSVQILKEDSNVNFIRCSDSVASNINLILGDDKMFALWDAENKAGFMNLQTPETVRDLKEMYDIR